MDNADRSNLNELADLLGGITALMFCCDDGMPDAAMDALFVAHDAVVNEIVLTAGYKDAKEGAINVLVARNIDGIWADRIARIQGSIELDLSLAA